MFRLAQGKGWTEETATRVMSTRTEGVGLGKMQFASHASVTLASSGEGAKNPSSGAFEDGQDTPGDVFERRQIV